MLRSAPLFILAISVLLTTTPASATKKHHGLTISTDSTYNVSFKNGVFTAIGDKAVLSVTDLKIALQQGDIVVTTGNGPGGDEQGDLHIETELDWNSATSLSLAAYHSIFVDQPVYDEGAGGMSIVTNDGGSDGVFSIGQTGHAIETPGYIAFANLSDALSINGTAYALVGSIQSLAAAIAANPSGAYALAANYNASRDGTYSSAPVSTTFTGNFDGLGNTVSGLEIRDTQDSTEDGLFKSIQWPATVSHLKLSGLKITAVPVYYAYVGGLASFNSGTLFEDSAAGTMSVTIGRTGWLGGLIGESDGVIDRSSAKVAITFGPKNGVAGGLVGYDFVSQSEQNETGAITNSRAKGAISAQVRAVAGGLVGDLEGASIATSYATGSIICIKACDSGGLIGEITQGYYSRGFFSVTNSYATGDITHLQKFGTLGGLIGSINTESNLGVAESYSTGAPTGGAVMGGFVGSDSSSAGSLTSCYWDTDTSGITNPSQGAGYPSNDPGITGQTTKQLQSGLPQGFDSAIWAESKKINGGLHYLIYNQP
jgi:hypothetical protein